MSAMDARLAELIELIEGAKERGLAEALERTEGEICYGVVCNWRSAFTFSVGIEGPGTASGQGVEES